MEAPDKIYCGTDRKGNIAYSFIMFPDSEEYIRKDVVDNMLKTAEDHAYFAGSEAMREKAINSVWHDAKEPPEIRRKYLVRYNDGKINGSWERQSNVIPWKNVVKEHHFTHWCYVEDLIPKSK